MLRLARISNERGRPRIGTLLTVVVVATLAGACGRKAPSSMDASFSAASADLGAGRTTTVAPQTPVAPTASNSPMRADPEEAKRVFQALRILADRKDVSAMAPFLYGRSRARLTGMPAERVAGLFAGDVVGAEVNGGRVLLRLSGAATPLAAMFLTESGFKYDPLLSQSYREVDAGPRIPENQALPLAEALRDIPGTGKLFALIATSEGEFACELFDDRAPLTVANFVGLARGLRAFRDVPTGKWVRRPFYDGLTFHRVVPRFMIQGGCPKGNGSGDPGYSLADEFHVDLRHDRPGRLSMANSGPNTNGSQFFITEVPTPWLDDRHSIFGQCDPASLAAEIARVPATQTRPDTPVLIRSIRFERR